MHVTRLLLAGIVFALWASLAGASSPLSHDLAEPELLLFDPVPMVISAAWTKKSPLDAPNAATVITSPDIHASGATSPPQLLH